MEADRLMDGDPAAAAGVPLSTILREWTRIGITGFGGPPAHIALLRRLCVEDRGWLSAAEFEDGIAATNLLPGPASTQLAIYCAWRLRRTVGALVGGFCFIVPGLIVILGLAALFLAEHPPTAVAGAAAGAGAAVAAVALHAASGLIPASRKRATRPGQRVRWFVYLAAGAVGALTLGPFLVLTLAVCGVVEIVWRRRRVGFGSGSGSGSSPGAGSAPATGRTPGVIPALFHTSPALVATGGLAALAWVALKVGALSYGGGFVIIPLMQADAVHHYHWMTDGQFTTAVALGQITPGPVVQTVAVVGYAAAGVGGGLLASAIAFAPSFVFVLAGGRSFDRLRRNAAVQAFLDGAGPAAIGAILGSAATLAATVRHPWQAGVLGLAVVWLLVLRRGVVSALLGAAGLGVIAALAGWAL